MAPSFNPKKVNASVSSESALNPSSPTPSAMTVTTISPVRSNAVSLTSPERAHTVSGLAGHRKNTLAFTPFKNNASMIDLPSTPDVSSPTTTAPTSRRNSFFWGSESESRPQTPATPYSTNHMSWGSQYGGSKEVQSLAALASLPASTTNVNNASFASLSHQPSAGTLSWRNGLSTGANSGFNTAAASRKTSFTSLAESNEEPMPSMAQKVAEASTAAPAPISAPYESRLRSVLHVNAPDAQAQIKQQPEFQTTTPEDTLFRGIDVDITKDKDVEQPETTYLTGWRNLLQGHYYLMEDEPKLVLPSAPTDIEKYSFLVTHRFFLCTVGVFGFLSASAGIWLFTLCSNIFYWFGVFAGFIQCYLSLFYITGCISKNFDFENHTRVLKETVLNEETAPTIDIFLPCCKEPLEILENTYRHIVKMKYPAGKLLVHVLDDGAMPEVKALAKQYGLNYICRDDRPRLKKAGNLRWAFARTSGDFFVIYDADFCPRDDFLVELIPRMMEDHKIAIIQTPQYFRTTKQQTWVERGAGSVQELFYRFIQVNRDKWGGAICVGSNAVYRREALKETGGTAEVGASEDVHTGFFAITCGWTVRFMPICLACGICPDTPRSFFSQQIRWCQGSTSLLLNMHFWKSNLSWQQKACYLSGMLYYSASALGIFTNPAPGILLMWFRLEFLNYYNLLFAIPNILYGLLVFRLWSRSTHSLAVQQIAVIQQYAYLSALVDRVIGTSFTWVPSGDGGAHKNNRFRNYRLFCIFWTFFTQGAFISVVTYRLLQHHVWYNFLPLILLDTYNLYITLPYIICK